MTNGSFRSVERGERKECEAEPNRADPRQTEPSRAKPNQTKPCQAEFNEEKEAIESSWELISNKLNNESLAKSLLDDRTKLLQKVETWQSFHFSGILNDFWFGSNNNTLSFCFIRCLCSLACYWFDPKIFEIFKFLLNSNLKQLQWRLKDFQLGSFN